MPVNFKTNTKNLGKTLLGAAIGAALLSVSAAPAMAHGDIREFRFNGGYSALYNYTGLLSIEIIYCDGHHEINVVAPGVVTETQVSTFTCPG